MNAAPPPRPLLPPSPQAIKAVQLYKEGQLGPAQRLCEQLVSLHPDERVAVHLLGAIAADQGRLDDAVEWFERAIALDPAAAALPFRLGGVRVLQGRYDDALACFDAAHAADPSFTPAIAGTASVFERQGRFAEAEALIEPIVARGDADARVTGIAALLCERTGRHQAAVEILETFLARDTGPPEASGRLLYQLGRVLDALGETERAYEAIRDANTRWTRPYDPNTDFVRFDRWRTSFTAERCAAMARATGEATGDGAGAPTADAEQLIFIVGMPRCGSTLVEQILDAHPDVHGAGENEIVHRLVYGLPGARRDKRPPPEIFADLNATALGMLSRGMIDEFRARRRREVHRR